MQAGWPLHAQLSQVHATTHLYSTAFCDAIFGFPARVWLRLQWLLALKRTMEDDYKGVLAHEYADR